MNQARIERGNHFQAAGAYNLARFTLPSDSPSQNIAPYSNKQPRINFQPFGDIEPSPEEREANKQVFTIALKAVDFDFFCGFTSPYCFIRDEFIWKIRRFDNKANRKTSGHNYHKHLDKGNIFAFGVERQINGSYHAQAAVKADYKKISKSEFIECLRSFWQELSGCDEKGISISPFIKGIDGENYICKEGDVILSKNFPSPF